MRRKDKPLTAVEKIRAAIVREVHFVEIAAVEGEPSILRIHGPAAGSGVAQRAVVGHERALFRAGFRKVECVGTDPDDPRGRPGRWSAVIPEEGAPWAWDACSGEALQERIMRGDEVRPRPRLASEPPGASVHSLAARRARR